MSLAPRLRYEVQRYLDMYGVGVPFAFFAAGSAALWFSLPGAVQWGSMTVYGRFGLTLLLLVSAALLALSAYLYMLIEYDQWLQTEEDDAQLPVPVDDDK